MRHVPVAHLRTGDRLGRDVYARPDALPLLRAGVRVSDSYRKSLIRAGIAAVWVDDGISAGIEPLEVLEESTKLRATAAVREAFVDVTRTLPSGGELTTKIVEEMARVAELIVEDIGRS